jgi:hypothetical protein
VAFIGEIRNAYSFSKYEGRHHLIDISTDGPINSKKQIMKLCSGFSCLRIGPVASSCGHDGEPLCFVKDRKFFDQLSDHKLLKKRVRYL